MPRNLYLSLCAFPLSSPSIHCYSFLSWLLSLSLSLSVSSPSSFFFVIFSSVFRCSIAAFFRSSVFPEAFLPRPSFCFLSSFHVFDLRFALFIKVSLSLLENVGSCTDKRVYHNSLA